MSTEELAFRGFALILVVYLIVIGAIVALYYLRDWLKGHPPVLPPPADYKWLLRNGPKSRQVYTRRKRIHEVV